MHTVGSEGDWIGLSGPSVFTFTFNGDKASGYRSEHWAGYEDPFWPTVPPDENGEYPPAPVYWQLELYDSTTVAWSNSKLASFKNSNGKLTFNYTNDLLTSIQPETGSSFERQIGTITYSYENKNYWAKHIRNKDVLMLLFNRVFHPLEQNPTKICVKGKDNYDTEILETYEYKSKYNEDGYPIEICETHSGIRHNTHEPFKVNTTYLIRYKTIPQLN
ncbi:hypothetical protein D3C78_1243220 [compost metagenome]